MLIISLKEMRKWALNTKSSIGSGIALIRGCKLNKSWKLKMVFALTGWYCKVKCLHSNYSWLYLVLRTMNRQSRTLTAHFFTEKPESQTKVELLNLKLFQTKLPSSLVKCRTRLTLLLPRPPAVTGTGWIAKIEKRRNCWRKARELRAEKQREFLKKFPKILHRTYRVEAGLVAFLAQ